MGSRDIEKDQLIGFLGVVLFGDLHRVARVAQVLKLDALDHPPFLHVQARDDALSQHYFFFRARGGRGSLAILMACFKSILPV